MALPLFARRVMYYDEQQKNKINAKINEEGFLNVKVP